MLHVNNDEKCKVRVSSAQITEGTKQSCEPDSIISDKEVIGVRFKSTWKEYKPSEKYILEQVKSE